MHDHATPDDAPHLPESRLDELERTCFVIMPFGVKDVAGEKVDFDGIFEVVFRPAIEQATTPEGEQLIAKRTDVDAFSGSINQDMFEYIMYSRVAFADISGFNPNVLYEVGARHSVQESGTVLFRQLGHAIPFDIATIKVFEYEHDPEDRAEASRAFITRVVADSLAHNRLDSPVRLALRAQWPGERRGGETGSTDVGSAVIAAASGVPIGEDVWRREQVAAFLHEAEESTRLGDLPVAERCYWAALRLDPTNIIARMRLGLTYKQLGRHSAALEEFTTITKLAPDYGEAWKEKGIAEGLIARKIDPASRPEWLADGYDALRRATMLTPDDFDAWSSLGGVLKNVRGDLAGARAMYAHASEISNGHPYPLLNALKLAARESGELDLGAARDQLTAAERLRLGQVEADPPVDLPWAYFDLAEIRLFQGDEAGFLDYVAKGIESCDAAWQIETFRNSLQTNLADTGLNGLERGIQRLNDSIAPSGGE